jgi:predicted ATPase
MAHLHAIGWEELPLQLVPESFPSHENAFTLVVGQNGVGKSRLLADLCKRSTKQIDMRDQFAWTIDQQPRVIAVSTGVFDRFPSNARRLDSRTSNFASNYTYLGVRREFMGSSSVMSLLSNAARGLLRRLNDKPSLRALTLTFGTINCHPFVEMVFKPSFRAVGAARDFSLRDPLSKEAKSLIRLLGEIDARILSEFEIKGSSDRASIVHAATSLRSFLEMKSVVSVGVDFKRGSITTDLLSDGSDFATNLRLLLDAGLVRMMDLVLQKIDHGRMSLRRASSGEQCLLTIILGIAGHLTDDSLVLIDEPEISLHPEWQEKFMELLVAAVSGFNGCQFVVATHSPQLVSRAPTRNCFVVSLSQRQLRPASVYANKSADVQLAELFQAPGAKNEYIARLAFNLLARIRAAKAVTPEQHTQLAHLKSLVFHVDRREPIVELIDSITGVVGYYGSDS